MVKPESKQINPKRVGQVQQAMSVNKEGREVIESKAKLFGNKGGGRQVRESEGRGGERDAQISGVNVNWQA